MAKIFQDCNYPNLYILCNPRAKYYVVCDERYLEEAKDQLAYGHIRLVMNVTFRELRNIVCQQTQLDLDLQTNPGAAHAAPQEES